MASLFESIPMRSPLVLTVITHVLLLLASVPAHAQATTGLASSTSDSALVASLAGCYELSVGPRTIYHLRLTQRRVGSAWVVQEYGLVARNVAGGSWSWSPTDTTDFHLSWGGVDSAMQFDIMRRAGALVTHGTMYRAGAPTRSVQLDARIHRVTCAAHPA